MTYINRVFSLEGPYSYPVLASGLTIEGGTMVIPDSVNPGGAQIAGAGAKNCLGVCVAPGAAAGVFSSTDAAALPDFVSVGAGGVFPVTFAASAVMGQDLKCAASGEVTPWIDGTDDPEMKIGKCYDPAVASGAVGNARINIP
jgi:hypothetical protein